MTTIISTDAKTAQQNIAMSAREVSASVNNLVSGRKENANVADFSVGTILESKVSVLKTALLNAGQAISLLQTAKGALNTIVDLINQQKNLAVKASDDSLSNNERSFLNQEFQALSTEIDRIADNTNFNSKKLINGDISGKASITTATSETTQNYSLVAAGDFGLRGTVASGSLATSGTLGITAAPSVGDRRAQATLQFSSGAGAIVAGQNTMIFTNFSGATTTLNFTAVVSSAAGTAAAFVTAANRSTNAAVRTFSYIDNGDGSVGVVANNTGNGNTENTGTFNLTTATTNVALTLNTTSVVGSAQSVTSVSGLLGTDRGTTDTSLTTSTDTFDSNLIGKLTNFTASVEEVGGSGAGAETNRFKATFTVDANGTTYTSQDYYLGTSSSGGDSLLRSGSSIVFENLSGPVISTTSGTLRDNAFSLTIGSSDITVADGAFDVSTVRSSLNTIVSDFETQLAATTITQDRNAALDVISTTNDDLASAAGTLLQGLKGYNASTDAQGDIIFRSDAFGSDTNGSLGSLGSFDFDRTTGILSTSIDGVTYSADLTSTADTTTTTGQGYYSGGTAFNTSTGLFTNDGTIVLATADTTDGNEIRIDLATNVGAQISTTDINTADRETGFENAFNEVFGVSASESLSFQVGNESSDSIGVSIGSAKINALHKDDAGVAQTLDITTLTNAQAAGDTLDNALNTVVSLIADVDAAISSFNSAISNNDASVQNADAARAVLLDTDYSQESTTFAESRVKLDAAQAILAQVNSRVQNLLQLLQQ